MYSMSFMIQILIFQFQFQHLNVVLQDVQRMDVTKTSLNQKVIKKVNQFHIYVILDITWWDPSNGDVFPMEHGQGTCLFVVRIFPFPFPFSFSIFIQLNWYTIKSLEFPFLVHCDSDYWYGLIMIDFLFWKQTFNLKLNFFYST